jgi:hypothetical protein
MVILKGRAATPVRPGYVIKAVLSGQIPLVTGQIVTEASINDIHGAYKEQIRRENSLRSREKRLRGMTAFSFKTLFKFAQLLGLVELVREEPMQFPPPHGHLYSLRKHDGIHVVISTRRIFKLTDIGKEDELSWTNLCKAWMEQWPAPQKMKYIQPLPRPEKPARAPEPAPAAVGEVPIEEAPPFTPLAWVPRPSDREFKKLLGHLETLSEIGMEDLAVRAEVGRLSSLVDDWVVYVDERLDEAKAISFKEAIGKLAVTLGLVVELAEALRGVDLPRAIDVLGRLIRQ